MYALDITVPPRVKFKYILFLCRLRRFQLRGGLFLRSGAVKAPFSGIEVRSAVRTLPIVAHLLNLPATVRHASDTHAPYVGQKDGSFGLTDL